MTISNSIKKMNLISILLPIFVIALFPFQILSQNPPKSGTDLIVETCDQTPYKDLCKTILQSAPKNNNGSDLLGLAKAALELTSENATKAYESISKMQQNSTDHYLEQCLMDCSENYQDAIDQLDDAITAMDFKAYNDVKTWLAAAMTDAETCEEGFKENPDYQSPVTQMNTVFNQLCNICLAITTRLEGK